MGSCVVITVGVVVLGIIVLTISLVATSLRKLNSDEVGLMYDTFQKSLKEEPYQEGLHLGTPGYRFIKFPSVFRSIEYDDIRCLNSDGVSIILDIGFQYRVRPQALKSIVTQFTNESGYLKIVNSIGMSAIYDVCSLYNITRVLEDRGSFQDDLARQLVTKFDVVHCDVTDLQVRDIRRPAGYEQSIIEKESAREDIQVAVNERPQRLTVANTIRRETQTQADIIRNRAYSEARILTAQASAEAAGILNDFRQEAATYKTLISNEGLGLDTEGFLAYLGVRVLSEARNTVMVGFQAPATASYRDQLSTSGQA